MNDNTCKNINIILVQLDTNKNCAGYKVFNKKNHYLIDIDFNCIEEGSLFSNSVLNFLLKNDSKYFNIYSNYVNNKSFVKITLPK